MSREGHTCDFGAAEVDAAEKVPPCRRCLLGRFRNVDFQLVGSHHLSHSEVGSVPHLLDGQSLDRFLGFFDPAVSDQPPR